VVGHAGYGARLAAETEKALARLDASAKAHRVITDARWKVLADMRKVGKKPGLPVFITMRPKLARNVEGAGCFSIVHGFGKPVPVELLDGLDVMLDFEWCYLAGRVKRLMDERGVKPKSMRAWCACADEFVVTCGKCDDGSEPWAA
jgi:hypothetical protein